MDPVIVIYHLIIIMIPISLIIIVVGAKLLPNEYFYFWYFKYTHAIQLGNSALNNI